MQRPGQTTTSRIGTGRSAARLMLIIGMISVFLLPVAGASAQVPSAGRGGNGGVSLEQGLTYDLVYESLPTAGESSMTPAYAGITGLDVAPDGTVFFAEHHGGIQTLDPDTGVATYLGRVNAATHKCATCEETNLWESGLHGFALANDFEETGHLYISYTVANSTCEIPANIEGETDAGCWHLSRFTYEDGEGLTGGMGIDFSDETVLLDWPFSRYGPTGPGARSAAHQSGGITVLPDDTIVISVGDNTSHTSHGGYGPRDPRPENWWFNGERTSLNPADRRGKLLRVNPDGSVPADNPFVGQLGEYRYGGEVAYDPYVLAEGMRNPYRVTADPKTGTIYSGQVGPDASLEDPDRGPGGEEELNVISRTSCQTPTSTGECTYHAFNGGYPRCIGPNRPYVQYDYEAGQSLGIPEDCSGYDEPVLYYAKRSADGEEWPQLQTGGGSTIVPLEVYNNDGEGALGSLQDDLLLFEWSKGWMATIPVTDSGELDVSTENVEVVGRGFKGPIAAAVAPDGSVYVAEFGGYFSFTSRIGRISAAAAEPIPALTTQASAMASVVPVAVLIPTVLLGLVATIRRRRLV